MFYPDAYTSDGDIDVAYICRFYSNLYTAQDIRDAVHWMAINGAIHKSHHMIIWGGFYDLSEIIRQSELFLHRLENLQAGDVWNDKQWIETAILRPVVNSEMGATA